MKITFDSNAWRPIASPSSLPDDQDRGAFDVIRAAIQDGRVEPFLSDTAFTLEAIRRDDRLQFFAHYQGKMMCSEESKSGGLVLGLGIAPDPNSVATTHEIAEEHLQDALSLGFRLLRATRVAGVMNPGLKDEYYAASSDVLARAERFGDCSRAIEAEGWGHRHLKDLGNRYSDGGFWLDGLRKAPSTERGAVRRAVAEWSDADSVALHHAYQNDYFCTRDQGRSENPPCVLSAQGRAWLNERYAVKCVSPNELVALL